ncbi:MAG: type secretion system protein [Pseudomonadota bacterium]|jgi:general secretion pathway protein I
MTARSQSGFSLLEVVVAIAVFSLGAMATLNVLGQSGRNADADEARLIAGIVAENRIAEAMAMSRPPPTGATRGSETALSRTWDWEMRVATSPEPRILRIDVSVRETGRAQVLAEYSSFRAAR